MPNTVPCPNAQCKLVSTTGKGKKLKPPPEQPIVHETLRGRVIVCSSCGKMRQFKNGKTNFFTSVSFAT